MKKNNIMKVLYRGMTVLIWCMPLHYNNILYHYYTNSGLTSGSGIPSADISTIHGVKVVEEKDGKHTTCIVSRNDPPLKDTRGNWI